MYNVNKSNKVRQAEKRAKVDKVIAAEKEGLIDLANMPAPEVASLVPGTGVVHAQEARRELGIEFIRLGRNMIHTTKADERVQMINRFVLRGAA